MPTRHRPATALSRLRSVCLCVRYGTTCRTIGMVAGSVKSPRRPRGAGAGGGDMVYYPARIAQVRAAMERSGVDVLFLPNSSALEWLTGLKRELGGPTEHNHNGGWVAGAYLGLTGGAILLEPRLHAELVERQLPGKPWLAERR